MHSKGIVGFSDADTAALAEIVADVEKSQQLLAAAQAAQIRALARAGDLARKQSTHALARVREHDMALRAISAEVAGIMKTTDRSVQRQIGEATELVEDYPATLQAWEEATITRGHVRAIVETGAILPPDQRPAFEAEALAKCAVDTPGRVRGELALLAERLHPRTLTERHREARDHRRVEVLTLADGMSALTTTGPTLLIDAIYDRLTQQARAIVDARSQAAADLRAAKNGAETDAAATAPQEPAPWQAIASDTRTMDQLRADIVADMLLTAAPDADPTRTDDAAGTLGAIRARVQIVVPALTLLGAADEPADLVGRSPIDAETARELACLTRSPWERILTNPVTGAVLHVDTYQRTAAIDRYLRARDQHCRFPGCRLPAIRCEVDHTIDHALGGKTDTRNLAHLCQRHHSMKQFTAWRVRQLGDGVLEWRSPLGRTYIDQPPPLGVHFRPVDDAAQRGDPPDGAREPDDDSPDDIPF
ncbi:DUF222 domain-containing protein [uncultured Microbacterium sp.]|uniref:HNH endonuclease signature motif containing protein n=1 Tax=uncultured Microbacterium sp. TaxID=191216 RepID=UPI0028D1801F|nr:DUF222 domain-containing protein [uncultured Microbacterium sp.]